MHTDPLLLAASVLTGAANDAAPLPGVPCTGARCACHATYVPPLRVATTSCGCGCGQRYPLRDFAHATTNDHRARGYATPECERRAQAARSGKWAQGQRKSGAWKGVR